MKKRIGVALSRLGFGRISAREYQANLSGLNILFGAVLGFVLTGTETLDEWKFGFVLLTLAAFVVSILYISHSRHRLVYAIATLIGAMMLPELIDWALDGHGLLPDKVRPTLVVWTVMTILVEFWGRDSRERAPA